MSVPLSLLGALPKQGASLSSGPVVIIGAGYAGLVAAKRLLAEKIPFRIFEASESVAGLAATFTDMPGFKYDFGTHLITNRLANTLGIQHQCRDVSYFGESVVLRERTYSYPFGMIAVPRFALSALASRFASSGVSVDAATWAETTLGRVMAREVAIPLMESLTGTPAEELAPAVGSKLPSVLRTLMLRTSARISGKAVAIGYCQDLPENAGVWHVYPEGGIVMICKGLAADIGEHIRLKTPVKRVIVENGVATGVETSDGLQPASAVISTAPVNVLPRLAPEAEQLKKFGAFRYSSMLFVNIFLRGRGLLPNVAVWFPEKKYDFFRVQEPPISLPWTAPENQTYLTFDIGCEVGGALWNEDDSALAESCMDQLRDVVPDIRSRFIGARVLRTKIAYPVYLKAYEEERKNLSRSTGVRGLHSVGRNGEFAHILMEDVYLRTMRRASAVVDELGAV